MVLDLGGPLASRRVKRLWAVGSAVCETKKSVVGVMLVTTQKKRSQRALSILESKKFCDLQAGPRFHMVKKKDNLRTTM